MLVCKVDGPDPRSGAEIEHFAASVFVDGGDVEFAVEEETPDVVGDVELVVLAVVVGSPVLSVACISSPVLKSMFCDGGCYGGCFALAGGVLVCCVRPLLRRRTHLLRMLSRPRRLVR